MVVDDDLRPVIRPVCVCLCVKQTGRTPLHLPALYACIRNVHSRRIRIRCAYCDDQNKNKMQEKKMHNLNENLSGSSSN